MTGRKLNIVVSGMIAATPFQGGATWAVLQYLLGFQRLGHDVIFVESLSPDAVGPPGAPLSLSDNVAYIRKVMFEVGLDDRWTILLAGTTEAEGMPPERLSEAVRRSDLLLNIAGTIADEIPVAKIPIRIYLDLDPVFTQFWASLYEIDMGFEGHTHFVTVGQAIGHPECLVPTCGLDWLPTLQPVVLDHWPVAGDIATDALTTVANWRSYGSIHHDGAFYGQKAHSLRQFMNLPGCTSEAFALALSIHPDERPDLVALRDAGWCLLDPTEVAATPASYRAFVQGSRAEFGFAKDGYVSARSGWFSDRSACYLASGRPVIAQDTGFSDFLPTGTGLLSFDGIDDVLAALDDLRARYDHHRRAAREIAVEYFDSDRVLGRLLSMVGAEP